MGRESDQNILLKKVYLVKFYDSYDFMIMTVSETLEIDLMPAYISVFRKVYYLV